MSLQRVRTNGTKFCWRGYHMGKWRNHFYVYKKIKEAPFVKHFQFKLLHKRIVTNKTLLYMGISNSSTCPYCEEQVETIEHAFIQCKAAKSIWREVEIWLKQNIDNKINIPDIDKIFGVENENDIVGTTGDRRIPIGDWRKWWRIPKDVGENI